MPVKKGPCVVSPAFLLFVFILNRSTSFWPDLCSLCCQLKSRLKKPTDIVILSCQSNFWQQDNCHSFFFPSPRWTICSYSCQLECFCSVSVFSPFGHGSDLMSTKQIRFHCHGTDINSESTEILTNPGHTRHWLHIRVMLQIKNFVFNLGKWRHF